MKRSQPGEVTPRCLSKRRSSLAPCAMKASGALGRRPDAALASPSVPVLPRHACRRRGTRSPHAPRAPTSARRRLRGGYRPRAGPGAPLCSRPCALVTASRSLRVANAAARRARAAGRAGQVREGVLLGLLGLSSRTSRLGLVSSRLVSARLVLTAITWNHDEPPISHNYQIRNVRIRDILDLPKAGSFSCLG